MAIAPEDTLMYSEAAESADVVERQFAHNEKAVAALGEQLRATAPTFVATCARGSSDHACTYAKYLIETQLGYVTASASPSVGSVYKAEQKLDGALYIAISQSGKSPDLVTNATAARAAGAHVVALVNVEQSPLAEAANTVLPLCGGAEKSVAATKSYISSLAAILQLVAYWKDDATLKSALKALPDALRNAFKQDWTSLSEGLVNAPGLFILGRGLGLAVAQEAALKCKETSGLHAEAYSSAEVKHGPMALVGPELPVLLLGQNDATLDGSVKTALEFRARGGKVWTAVPAGIDENGGEYALPTVAAPHPACEPLLVIQSYYKAVNALAIARGFNPDVPPHLNKVTETV